jgi:probable LLM family oxidoreductase
VQGKHPVENFEFGLDSFVNASHDENGGLLDGAQVVRNTVEQALLAESVGIDSFNIAEHYRAELMDTASHVMLAAIASRTSTLRLGTAVTVLSTQDPVRLFTEFSTLDAVSDGRAQLVVGRGSATESFPLFGFDLADYEELFEEKLDLFTKLLREQPVTWSGKFRSPLKNQTLNPPLPAGHLPTWVGVGGSPNSVLRAAKYGLPMMLAIIGGHPSRFSGHVDLYHRALQQFGHKKLPVGVHSPGYIADTEQEAFDIQWPYYAEAMNTEAKIRGWRSPVFEHYEAEATNGSMYIGSPETVAPRIADTICLLGLERFDLAYATGPMPHELKMKTIELYGREVIPRVREILADASDNDGTRAAEKVNR